MALQLIKIASLEAGSAGVGSFTFSSIPQGYTDLKIVLSARTASGGVGGVRISPNGSTSSLSEKQLEATGSGTPGSYSTTQGYIAVASGATDTANTFSNCELYFPSYNSSNNKSWTADYASENNATTAYAGFTAGLWSNTAAITSIALSFSANFGQYSTATLYGIL